MSPRSAFLALLGALLACLALATISPKIVRGTPWRCSRRSDELGPWALPNTHAILPYVETDYSSKGYLVDESRFSVIALPDSLLLCLEITNGPTDTHTIRCLKVPPGTILLVPTPPDTL